MHQQILAAYGSAAPPPPATYGAAVLADSPTIYLRFLAADTTVPVNSGSVTLSSSSFNAATTGEASLCGDAGDASVLISSGAGTRGPRGAFAGGAALGAAGFTLEAIIYPTSLSGQRAILSGNGDSSAELRIISGKVNLIRKNVGIVAIATTTLSANTRYHIAVTIGIGGTYTFYLNGAPDGTGAGSTSFNASQNQIHVGEETIGGSTFNGWIDEVAIYNTALSGARIAAHAAAMT